MPFDKCVTCVKMAGKRKICVLAPYPKGVAPSQRFRFELFFSHNQPDHVTISFKSFYTQAGWKAIYRPGIFQKIIHLLTGYFRRIGHILTAISSDVILIHRELTPFGPPVYEFILYGIFNKKIVYDFDDAIWLNDGHDPTALWSWLKWRKKIKLIIKWSSRISAGNNFLADYALRFNPNATVIPTVVDTARLAPSRAVKKDKITIGWTGSHSTLFYLERIVPVIRQLEQQYEFRFLVIANKNPEFKLKSFEYKEWKKETENEDLGTLDIGLMPLEDVEWAKGKCGFKLIQYGAKAIPSVASPVGVNSIIITSGKNGILAKDNQDWYRSIETLLTNSELRIKMGIEARKKVDLTFSASSVSSAFWRLLFF